MNKWIFVIVLIIPSTLMANDFDQFLKKFFADAEFQKAHIVYPIEGSISFMCDSNEDGTCEEERIFAKNSSQWEYLGYGYGQPGVIYERSDECPEKLNSYSKCIFIDLSESETDYNLLLYFIESNGDWKLIYLSYFEP